MADLQCSFSRGPNFDKFPWPWLSAVFTISVKSNYALKAAKVCWGTDSTFHLKISYTEWKYSLELSSFVHAVQTGVLSMLEQSLKERSFTKSKLEKKWIKFPHSSLLENNHTASAFMSTAASQWRTQSISQAYIAGMAYNLLPLKLILLPLLSSFQLTFSVLFQHCSCFWWHWLLCDFQNPDLV